LRDVHSSLATGSGISSFCLMYLISWQSPLAAGSGGVRCFFLFFVSSVWEYLFEKPAHTVVVGFRLVLLKCCMARRGLYPQSHQPIQLGVGLHAISW